jgi:antitoxin YefM
MIDRILYNGQPSPMKTVSYTDARNQLASLIEAANEDREPVTITRNGAAAVVLVDAGEYAAMAETIHLLASPKNAARLHKGLAEFKAGKFKATRRG